MRGEFQIIADFFAPLAAGAPGAEGLRNDAAVFDAAPGHSVVVTVDAMVEGVHFLSDDPPGSVGRKLLRVNLSDLAAMGARPVGYLLAAAFSKRIDDPWIQAFVDGLAADQRDFGVHLFGGDTVSTPGPLTLSLTAFGDVPVGRALPRAGAKAGDLVYVSGTIGDGALGLKALRGDLENQSEADTAYLAGRYRLPTPRVALGQALSAQGLATAALDVSDGLVADLGHICETSGLAAEVEAAKVPLSTAAERVLGRDPGLRAAVLTGGDDYELLFTVSPDRAAEVADLAARLGLPLARIGTMQPGAGVRVVDDSGRPLDLPRAGWSHF
jgi:thiamine-monophosphate kinase